MRADPWPAGPASPRCRVLNLHNNRVTAAGVRALVNSPVAAGLISPTVPNNPLGDNGVEAIAGSAVAANLEELVIHHTDSGERAGRALLASKGLTHIKELSLGLNLPKPLAAALAERSGPALC